MCSHCISGVDRFLLDINLMTKKTPSIWWKLCWCFITPVTIIAILLFILINHTAIAYDKYVYPTWSIGIGWIVALCSIAPIPIVAVSVILKEQGSFKQVSLTSNFFTDHYTILILLNVILYQFSSQKFIVKFHKLFALD